MLAIQPRHLRIAGVIALVAQSSSLLCADTINDPPHPHTASPVVTWHDGHDIRSGTHQHQHRTNHDPSQGVFIHGSGSGAAAYTTVQDGHSFRWVWVGRTLVGSQGQGHPNISEFAHGHQGHSFDSSGRTLRVQPPARYHLHTPVVGDDITVDEVSAWLVLAPFVVENAFHLWMEAGNVRGEANWPDGEDHERDNRGTVRERRGTGVPWHSSLNWVEVGEDREGRVPDHELHIVYGEAEGAALARTVVATPDQNNPGGHRPPGAGAVTLTMDDDRDWYWEVGAQNPNPEQYDALYVLLHEIGHVLGLGHFGTLALGYVMAPTGANIANGGFISAIDPDAAHGIRDLYAIAHPRQPQRNYYNMVPGPPVIGPPYPSGSMYADVLAPSLPVGQLVPYQRIQTGLTGAGSMAPPMGQPMGVRLEGHDTDDGPDGTGTKGVFEFYFQPTPQIPVIPFQSFVESHLEVQSLAGQPVTLLPHDGFINGGDSLFFVSGHTSFDIFFQTELAGEHQSFHLEGQIGANQPLLFSQLAFTPTDPLGSSALFELRIELELTPEGPPDFNVPLFTLTFDSESLLEFELPGDFNGDGKVDAADYIVWRKGLGSIYTQDDFNIWRANFGQTVGSGAGSAAAGALQNTVPEPDCLLWLATGVMLPVMVAWRGRHRWQVLSGSRSARAA